MKKLDKDFRDVLVTTITTVSVLVIWCLISGNGLALNFILVGAGLVGLIYIVNLIIDIIDDFNKSKKAKHMA